MGLFSPHGGSTITSGSGERYWAYFFFFGLRRRGIYVLGLSSTLPVSSFVVIDNFLLSHIHPIISKLIPNRGPLALPPLLPILSTLHAVARARLRRFLAVCPSWAVSWDTNHTAPGFQPAPAFPSFTMFRSVPHSSPFFFFKIIFKGSQLFHQ